MNAVPFPFAAIDMTINPYQPPEAESSMDGDDRRASLAATLSFGAYAGAIVWGTIGAVGAMVVGMWWAWIFGESWVAPAIGGAFLGCFSGGLMGALVGVPWAWAIWRCRSNWGINSLIGGILALVPVLGMLLALPATPDRLAASVTASWLSIMAVVLGLLVIGGAGGVWLARRIGQFAVQKQRNG